MISSIDKQDALTADRAEIRGSQGTLPILRSLLGFVGVGVMFAVWEMVTQSRVVDFTYLPPPTRIAIRLASLLTSGELTGDILRTLGTLFLGVIIGGAIGTTLAVVSGYVKWLRWATAPIVEFFRGLAPLALLPAFLLLFGVTAKTQIAILAWVAWVPIFINTLEGFDNVDSRLIAAARIMGAHRLKVLVSIVAPSIAPYAFAGLRLAIGGAFLAVVAAEMLGTNDGLGFFILEASETFRVVDMYAVIMLIGFIGISLNAVLQSVAFHLQAWRP